MYDLWMPRIGIIILGLIALVATIASAVISWEGRDVPAFLAAVGTSAATTIGVVVIALARPKNGGAEQEAPRK